MGADGSPAGRHCQQWAISVIKPLGKRRLLERRSKLGHSSNIYIVGSVLGSSSSRRRTGSNCDEEKGEAIYRRPFTVSSIPCRGSFKGPTLSLFEHLTSQQTGGEVENLRAQGFLSSHPQRQTDNLLRKLGFRGNISLSDGSKSSWPPEKNYYPLLLNDKQEACLFILVYVLSGCM